MANFYAITKSNKFRVTDAEKFKEIMSHVKAEDAIEIFEENRDGETLFSFGCESSIDGYYERTMDECNNDCDNCVQCDCAEGDCDRMIAELQTILPDDEAIIITEISWVKLRYVGGFVTVITKNNNRIKEMSGVAADMASEMLGQPYTIIE